MLIANTTIATGLALFTASSPIVRRKVRTFFVPAGRHRAAPQKTS